MKIKSLYLGSALAAVLALCGHAQAANVNVPADGNWYSFDVDDFTSSSGGLEWIALDDGSALSFTIDVATQVADGGDGFTALKQGTNCLGGAQDIDALTAYLANYNATTGHAAYNPAAAGLLKPRSTRVDAGTGCP